ncbi:hypothetical protein ACH79_06535 [Bradyrhizobium sp. CCBAU 051011]|nr:hypothetical protein ACH79_06535 [Bradyrhizobium sp. CCBAU 051011]
MVTIADYCHHIAPSLTGCCRHWYTNDGDGLNAVQASELAAILQGSIDACRIDDYARRLASGQSNIRLQDDSAEIDRLLLVQRPLPRHELERSYANEFVNQVQRFIDFLLISDGFEIL